MSTQVAVYYFPQYHSDPRNDKWHGPGWDEWALVRAATPRFAGHQQPKVPLWGHEDEAKPEVCARKIDAAADHGIGAFIFDWYWYEDGAFLERCLEQGFLKAPNAKRLPFCLMWANHDWTNIHPALSSGAAPLMASGKVSRAGFDRAVEHIIKNYFSVPHYWRVDGGLYFSFYELMSLVDGLGGIEQTRDALEHFRNRTRQAGLGEIHLNAVVWGVQILPTEKKITDPEQMLKVLGFDSTTSYVWVHHHWMKQFPTTQYPAYRDEVIAGWPKLAGQFSLPYYPNVSMGWDASPRTIQSDTYVNRGYPAGPVLVGNTPAEFEIALRAAKKFLADRPDKHNILTLNSWNEWTEGSYIEPDTVHGYAYLEAIDRVFGQRAQGASTSTSTI
jgi:hypothetical protein